MGPEIKFIMLYLLFLILHPYRDLEIISTTINGIDHSMLELKNLKKKEDYGLWSKFKKENKYGI